MNTSDLIAIDVFCTNEGVENTFILDLYERGLVQMTVVDARHYIAPEQLPRLEQLARMHYELEINLEGIEALSHMLERVALLQQELQQLRDRLGRYEDLDIG